MTLRPGGWWRDLRRAASWHRRALAAGLAGIAVAAGIQAVDPPDPATVRVLAAARDLVPGVPLSHGDITTVVRLPAQVPAGSLGAGVDILGRVVAGPVRAGEPLTDVRLVGPALVDSLEAGLVAAPVRVADAGMVALVRSGDRVDVLATPVSGDGIGSPTDVVGTDLLVLTVPAPVAAGAYTEGALLLLATTPATAQTLASATVTSRLSITLLGS